MKTKHLPSLLLLVLATCLGLNSCTNDLPDPEQLVEPNPDTNPDGALRPEDYVGQPVSFSGFTVTEVSTNAATRAVTGSKSEAFGKKGERVTIEMRVKSIQELSGNYHFADYILSPDGTSWVPAPQNKPLCWQNVNHEHRFTAYYPALTEQENKDRYKVSLPLTWTEDNYREHGSRIQSPMTKFSIGSPVSLSLRPLLTRIEVSIDPGTGITDATHLTMYTMTKGIIQEDGTIDPSGGVQEMNLWRSPSPAAATPGTPADPNPVFVGYAIPQTYAPGTLLLKHHTPDVNDARSYTVDVNPNFPDGLTTKGGEIVSFTVAAILPTEVHVKAAGELRAVLDAAFHTGDYPTRLKIIGEVDKNDLNYLVTLTQPAAAGSNITAVDMEEALGVRDAFGNSAGLPIFCGYKESIKNLVLPSSLSTVPNRAFAGSALTSVTLPERLKKIEYRAFTDCKYLKSITLPSSVTTLDMHAFAGSALTSIELPEALTEVGYAAFQDCTDLQQVALPGNMTINVGADVFAGINPSCHLFLYAPGLDTTSPATAAYLTGNWGGTTWENVHWGYKGSGSKLNPGNYEYHKVMP